MNFKTALTAIFVALIALTCTAGATEIVYDFSGIPDSPSAGTQYIVPVTVSGDVTGYKLTVSYDTDAAEIDFSFDENGSIPTLGGRPGAKKIVSADGAPKTFDLLITPLKNATITLKGELGGDIPCSTHDEIKFVFSGSVPTPTAGIVYNFSGIPDSPSAGTQYIVPVTVSGDATGYKLNVLYDANSAVVDFRNTGDATTGGRPGARMIVSVDGTPKTFDLLITPLSNATITLNGEVGGDIPCSIHDEIKFVFGGSSPTINPVSGTVDLTPTNGMIDWGAESIEIVDGAASIPVIMTGADRVEGITVTLKNVSGADVALNKTGSAVFRSGSATMLNWYSASAFTNNGTVSLYTIDISGISEGTIVSF
ncbi:hypothetical protein J5839_04275, partial [Methanosarcinaceae archaeon]|nr:hypothetical protein [Methanosarcinaceae archaeon]